jgi:hypothetical protein
MTTKGCRPQQTAAARRLRGEGSQTVQLGAQQVSLTSNGHGGNGACPGFGSVRIRGVCVNLGDLGPGGDPAITELQGDAVNGRYGVGMTAMQEERMYSVCLPGMVLGDDDICYDRKNIRNSDRMWPKGRPPLLTGGQRNAITIAARAGRQIETATKSLQKMGMLKKPAKRSMTVAEAKKILHHQQ